MIVEFTVDRCRKDRNIRVRRLQRLMPSGQVSRPDKLDRLWPSLFDALDGGDGQCQLPASGQRPPRRGLPWLSTPSNSTAVRVFWIAVEPDDRRGRRAPRSACHPECPVPARDRLRTRASPSMTFGLGRFKRCFDLDLLHAHVARRPRRSSSMASSLSTAEAVGAGVLRRISVSCAGRRVIDKGDFAHGVSGSEIWMVGCWYEKSGFAATRLR